MEDRTHIPYEDFGWDPQAQITPNEEDYTPPSSISIPPPRGLYMFKGDPEKKWRFYSWEQPDGTNVLAVELYLIISEGPHEGRKARSKVNTLKPEWRKSGTTMQDYLHAANIKPENGQFFTPSEIDRELGLNFEVPRKGRLEHVGRCSNRECPKNNKVVAQGPNGWKNPSKRDGFQAIGFMVDGEVKPVVFCPACLTNGIETPVRAFAEIDAWYKY